MSTTPIPRHRFVLAGGTVHDPATGRDGVVADIWVEGGRIIERPADATGYARIDATGLVVMPGGVDLHSHVAGPKVAAGRRLAPQLARGRVGSAPAAVPTIHATGALYAALGYTTVFDAAIATAAAGLAHRELAELPILDKGIYLRRKVTAYRPTDYATAPIITSPTSASVTTTTATLGGNVTNDGGSAVTARGVVYAETATNADPVIGGTGVTNAAAGAGGTGDEGRV